MPPAATAATCPNCNIPVRPGLPKCPKCKLEVAKFAPYRAAMEAAQKRGKTSVKVVPAGGPVMSTDAVVRAVKITKIVVLVALVAGLAWLAYYYFGPKPPRYLKFPQTAKDSATEFMKNVAGGDATYDQAYFLVADSVRSQKAADDRGDYVQVFNILNNYLTAEFGSDWITQTTIAPDPNDPDKMIATVGLETIHVSTAQQTPANLLAKSGPHYGILGVDELDVNYIGEMRKNAFIFDYLRAMGGKAAEQNLQTVLGANAGSLRNVPPFYRKIMILNALRDPRAASGYSVIQADSYCNRQHDPVVRARLQLLVKDERYDSTVRDWAQKVLDNKVDETDRAAAGVGD